MYNIRFTEFLLLVITLSQRLASGDRNPVRDQLLEWKKHHKPVIATGNHYEAVPTLTATGSIGPKGPLLFADFNYQAQLGNFVRERTPQRIVHARATGAKGYFVVTHDMSKYTKASLFHGVGTKTPVVVRLSTVVGDLGSADTVVDQRGLAIKFKTPEGIYDLLTLNTPVYPVRDPILFPSMTRSRGRNPATHLLDSTMYYDLASLRPETTLNVLQINSRLGRFKNYRHMEGHSINSFRWYGGTTTKKDTDLLFVRYHLIPNRKTKSLSLETYLRLAGKDADYMRRDLYNAIAEKKFPSWTMFVQMVTEEDMKNAKFNLFDPTKMLFESEFPMIPVGKLVLNANPKDFFSEVEQIAFNPGHFVPGISVSNDRVLQGRPFIYFHAHCHRIGVNFFQLPVNRPPKGFKNYRATAYLRDGYMNYDGNGDGGPNTFPNSFNGPYIDPKVKRVTAVEKGGIAEAIDVAEDDNMSQVDRYWQEKMSPADRKSTINTIAYYLSRADPKVQRRSLKTNWDAGNAEIGQMMRRALRRANAQKQRDDKKHQDAKRKGHSKGNKQMSPETQHENLTSI